MAFTPVLASSPDAAGLEEESTGVAAAYDVLATLPAGPVGRGLCP